MERYTLGILVNNHPGVLSRVVGLFSRRGYNIDSLSVGETEDPAISRIPSWSPVTDRLSNRSKNRLPN